MNRNKHLTRQRRHPRIYDWSFLVLDSIQKAVAEFAKKHANKKLHSTILDIGCGNAPYQTFFMGYEKYIKMDSLQAPHIDMVSTIENIPLPNESIDFMICTQVLEHADNFQKGIGEVRRVLKNGGHAFFSFPFAAHIHGEDDRWRFSLYTIKQIFSDFEIIDIRDSGGVFISWGQYLNTFIALFPLGRYFGIPLFVLINILARLSDLILRYCILPPFKFVMPKKAYEQMAFNVNCSLPLNYSVVIRK